MEYNISLDRLRSERLNGGRPILKAVSGHQWENQVVFNPACVFVGEKEVIDKVARELDVAARVRRKLDELGEICVLIYRAQGTPAAAEDYRHSRLGIAILSPSLELIYRHPVPIMMPENNFEDLGIEDPRITRIEDKFVMLYAGYSSHRASQNRRPGNKIGICIAFSDDLVHWDKRGPMQGKFNEIDNKNAVLFPEKLNGKYYILHRPMEGTDPMTVHVAHSSTLTGEWMSDGKLMAANEDPAFSKSWIGGGAPPLKIGNNEYIALYHTGHFRPDRTREYDIGISRMKFDGRMAVTERVEYFMRPESEDETAGNKSLGVNNVLFVCGAYLLKDYIYFPYAGADSVVLAGRINLKAK